jgi:hypothetical protein
LELTKARAILEVIATKLATSDESIDDYVKKTLLYHTTDRDELSVQIKSTLDDLRDCKLINSPIETIYEATLIGLAVVASSLTPEDGLFVHRELKRALEAFVLDGEMHAFYTFTPVQVATSSINVSTSRFFDLTGRPFPQRFRSDDWNQELWSLAGTFLT